MYGIVCKRLQVSTCLHYLDDVISITDCATSEGTYLIFVRSRPLRRSENQRGKGRLAIQGLLKEKVLLLFVPKSGWGALISVRSWNFKDGGS